LAEAAEDARESRDSRSKSVSNRTASYTSASATAAMTDDTPLPFDLLP
jgi:hypothetical protein